MAHRYDCFCPECRGEEHKALATSAPAVPERSTLVCSEAVHCSQCGKFHGDCDILSATLSAESGASPTNGVKDGNTMAKKTSNMPAPSGRKGNGYTGGQLPAPEGGTGMGNPFLSAKEMRKGKNKIQFLGKVRDAGPNSFSDLMAEVKVNGKVYDFGIKVSSGNYRRLFEEFGANPAKWKGTVVAEKGQYLGKDYIKIVD